MKKAIAFLGALAFVLVLLIKPFEFLETYSIHAGHAVHNAKANTADGHTTHVDDSRETSNRNVLVELAEARSDDSGLHFRFWIAALFVLGIMTLGFSIKRKSKDHDDE